MISGTCGHVQDPQKLLFLTLDTTSCSNKSNKIRGFLFENGTYQNLRISKPQTFENVPKDADWEILEIRHVHS